MSTRTETDSMGSLEVPAEAYYGAQTERARRNFQIGGPRFPRSFIRALGLIKKASAQVNVELGRLDARLGTAIVEAAQAVVDGGHDDQFIVSVFQTGSGTSTNMNANEVIASLANETFHGGRRGGRSPVHPNDTVNLGQSSNDVIPTAIHLAALEGVRRRLVPALESLAGRLEERAAGFDAVVKIGRTHLQDAVPVRLGQEFSGYAAQVRNAVRRVLGSSEALAELPIGGTAVGTGLNTHPEFGRRVAEALAREVGLPLRQAPNLFEALAGRDAAVEASGGLRSTAVSLSTIANNIRWLASGPRCGVGEVRLPELQPGSSIMPGKVNPVIPEAVLMAAAQVIGHDATIAWAGTLGSNFELNVMMPIIAHDLLESIELLTGAASHLADRCIDASAFLEGQHATGVVRLEANVERCRESVERSLSMCTALAPRIGYDNAAALAKSAYRENRTVREAALALVGKSPEDVETTLGAPASARILREHGDFPTAEEVERLLDPLRQTGPVPAVSRPEA